MCEKSGRPWPLSTASAAVHPVPIIYVLVCGAWRCGHRNSLPGRGQWSGQDGVRTGRGGPELGGGGKGPERRSDRQASARAPACGRGEPWGCWRKWVAWGLSAGCAVSGNRPRRRRRFPQFGPGQGQVECHLPLGLQLHCASTVAFVRRAGFRRTGRGAARHCR